MKIRLLSLVLVAASCASAQATPVQDAQLRGRASPAGLPSPVAAFVERSSECLHWSGEDAYDAERGAQIEKAVAALRCDKLPADAARLESRYRKNPVALKALREAQQE